MEANPPSLFPDHAKAQVASRLELSPNWGHRAKLCRFAMQYSERFGYKAKKEALGAIADSVSLLHRPGPWMTQAEHIKCSSCSCKTYHKL